MELDSTVDNFMNFSIYYKLETKRTQLFFEHNNVEEVNG